MFRFLVPAGDYICGIVITISYELLKYLDELTTVLEVGVCPILYKLARFTCGMAHEDFIPIPEIKHAIKSTSPKT